MYKYKLYGMHIRSDRKFIQLIEDDNAVDDFVIIEEGHFPEEYRNKEHGYGFNENDKSRGYFINSYCYMLIEDGKKITYEIKPDSREDLIDAYILGWGMSILGLQRSMLSIHCACLADENGAIIISGASGSGKSTVTTQLLNRGYRLIADDMVFVDPLSEECAYAYPAFPYNKLCRDAAIEQGYNLDELIHIDEDKDKYLIPCKDNFSIEKTPLKKIIMLTLTDQEEIFKEEIIGIKKMHACFDTLYMVDMRNDKVIGAEVMQMCLKLASKVDIFHISRPIFKNTADEVLEAALEYIQSSGA